MVYDHNVLSVYTIWTKVLNVCITYRHYMDYNKHATPYTLYVRIWKILLCFKSLPWFDILSSPSPGHFGWNNNNVQSNFAAISDMFSLRSSSKQVQKLRLMLTYTSKSFKKVFKAYFIWTFYNWSLQCHLLIHSN